MALVICSLILITTVINIPSNLTLKSQADNLTIVPRHNMIGIIILVLVQQGG